MQYGVYIAARGIPFFMTRDKSAAMLVCLLLDLVFFSLLILWTKHDTPEGASELPILYAVSPAGVLWSLSGNYMNVFVVPLLTVLIVLIGKFLRRCNRDSRVIFEKAYPAYLLFSLGSALYFAAKELGQRISWSTTDAADAPVLLALAILLMLFGAVYGILLGFDKKERKVSRAEAWFFNESRGKLEQKKRPSLVSLILLLALTGLYSAAVFTGIGDIDFPTSPVCMNTGDKSNQIRINIGGHSLTDVLVCIGEKEAQLSFYTYDSGSDKWNSFDSHHDFNSCFNWGRAENIPEGKIGWLGIVAHEGSVNIYELVLLDENGEKILPVNAEDYPELFDEQGSFAPESIASYSAMTASQGKNAPLGGRFAVAVCGVLSIPVIFGIAFLLIGKEKYALIAAILHCSEFMHLTLTRICAADIIAALLVLVVFFIMTLLVTRFLRENRKGWVWSMLGGVSLAVIVSLLGYRYYAVASSEYSSEWFTWPLNLRGVLYSFYQSGNGTVSVLATLGNPLISLLGLASFAAVLMMSALFRDRKALLLAVMYLGMLIPWCFVKRSLSLNQYYLSAQILTVMVPFAVSRITKRRVRVILSCAAVALSVALFLWFYPALTGIPVKEEYLRQLCFLESWRVGV